METVFPTVFEQNLEQMLFCNKYVINPAVKPFILEVDG